MKRRAIAGILGLLLIIAGVGTASAQTSPTVPETTTTSVLGVSTTNTTTTTTRPTTTTTTEATTTTTTEATTTTEVDETTTTAVEGEQVTPTSERVLGAVTRRPLPRTGNDIGGTAVFGGALTVLGIGLALGARRRRNSFESA